MAGAFVQRVPDDASQSSVKTTDLVALGVADQGDDAELVRCDEPIGGLAGVDVGADVMVRLALGDVLADNADRSCGGALRRVI